MRLAIVANPVSGGGRVRRHGAAVRDALAARNPDTVYVETTGPGHAARLAGDFARDGYDLVLAYGGDGTASETVDGLMKAATQSGTRLPEFGIIPAGTGMDFRRNFKIPTDPVEAALAALDAATRAIDIGHVTFHHEDGSESVRHFLNVASLGISGVIVTAVNEAKARGSRSGDLVYLLHSLREIMRFRPSRVRFSADGGPDEAEEVAVLAIANGGWFGGGMHLAPDAHPADGLLDLVIMRAASRPALLSHLAKVYGGRHRTSPDITFRRVTSLRVEPTQCPGDLPAASEMDGESTPNLPATYRVLPGALMFRG
jgi:YegS/Rv2252/BmrU family lipid kinase